MQGQPNRYSDTGQELTIKEEVSWYERLALSGQQFNQVDEFQGIAAVKLLRAMIEGGVATLEEAQGLACQILAFDNDFKGRET